MHIIHLAFKVTHHQVMAHPNKVVTHHHSKVTVNPKWVSLPSRGDIPHHREATLLHKVVMLLSQVTEALHPSNNSSGCRNLRYLAVQEDWNICPRLHLLNLVAMLDYKYLIYCLLACGIKQCLIVYLLKINRTVAIPICR